MIMVMLLEGRHLQFFVYEKLNTSSSFQSAFLCALTSLGVFFLVHIIFSYIDVKDLTWFKLVVVNTHDTSNEYRLNFFFNVIILYYRGHKQHKV